MSGYCCSHSKKPLSTKSVYCRTCCKGCFHQPCIQSRHLNCCPCCRLDSLQKNSRMLLWIAMVSLLEDTETDPCVTKRHKMGDGNGKTCIICLVEYREMGKVVRSNSCCKQTVHVAFLQWYYDLQATCQDSREIRKISVQTGIPNCFICRRMLLANIVPLDTDVLQAK